VAVFLFLVVVSPETEVLTWQRVSWWLFWCFEVRGGGGELVFVDGCLGVWS
jgi:hypothetical protein